MKKYIHPLGIFAGVGTMIAVLLLVAGVLSPQGAFANPLVLSPNVYIESPSVLTSATTTPIRMTPGTATSTITYDSYNGSTLCVTNCNGNPTKTDKLQLALQFKASSSAAILDYTVAYSNDNVDYFSEDMLPDTYTIGYGQINHASTTINHRWNPGSTSASTTRKLIVMDAWLRYTKLTFVQPVGLLSSNGELWASLTPIKQRAETK